MALLRQIALRQLFVLQRQPDRTATLAHQLCSRQLSDEAMKDNTHVTIPPYEDKIGEPEHVKKARLVYQSRKRGMLENGLLLSGFASKFLADMKEPQLSLYDRLINLPSNDWEIYYWATGVKETPQEFDHEVMTALKNYVKNEDRENRTTQPDLF